MHSQLSNTSKQKCFDLISGDCPMTEFEQWVYHSKELEQELSEADHLALISFNFQRKGAKYELVRLIKQFIDLGEYETQRIRKKLIGALNKEENLPELLLEFYNLHYRGYGFLEDLSMKFGLTINVPPIGNHDRAWEQLSAAEQDDIIEGFYPELDIHLKEVIDWIDTGQIVLTGETEDDYFLDYIDHRKPKERRILLEKVKRKWWQFWKPKLRQSGNFEPD